MTMLSIQETNFVNLPEGGLPRCGRQSATFCKSFFFLQNPIPEKDSRIWKSIFSIHSTTNPITKTSFFLNHTTILYYKLYPSTVVNVGSAPYYMKSVTTVLS